MIPSPANDFERVENAIAAQIEAQTEFTGLLAPDGSPWHVLTEDEGDITFMFNKMIADCGLAVMVKTPVGRCDTKAQNIPGPRFDPLICAVQVSEAVIFNRAASGTHIHVMTAADLVCRCLHLFTPTGVTGMKVPIKFVELTHERPETHPNTGELVSSVTCVFNGVLNLQSRTIT